MASRILVNMEEEVTCPICMELLTEPMSLDCGHTFCQACITANNRESKICQGESSCPVCRISYQPENLRPNHHVANIVEALRKVKLSPEEEQKRDLCVHHGEKLLLFCQEDEKIICCLCERSREHRGHHTFLMEEIAQEYKEKLQAALDRLKAEQQEAEKLDDDLEEERTSKKDKIENDLKSVQDYFKQLRDILASEEQKELQRLEKEAAENLDDLAQAESELAQQKKLLRDLISDLEHRLQGSTVEMLQDVKGIMERSKTFTLTKPKTLPMKQRRVLQAPDLLGMLQVFNEFPDVRRYWVHVTLDPPTDKSYNVISEDRRQVRSSPLLYIIADKTNYGVLGSPSITSGKHYWEVDVSGKHAWIMGVYGEKYPDSNRMDFIRQIKDSQPVCSIFQPKYGYWVIGLQNHSEYKAFVDSDSSDSSDSTTVTLFLSVPPHRVGVFLDYDAGTVSFFNVTNDGLLIYKFSSCSFSQKMFPYFNPMKCPASMRLCSPSS